MDLLSPRGFAQANGILSALVAVLGFVMPGVFGLFTLEMGHTVVHVLIAVISLWVGYGNVSDTGARTFAQIFGVVYLLLGVVGFLSADLYGLGTMLGLHMEMWENVLHIVLGAWAAYVGFRQ